MLQTLKRITCHANAVMITLSSKTVFISKCDECLSQYVKASRVLSAFQYSPCGISVGIMQWFISLTCGCFFNMKERRSPKEKMQAKENTNCSSWNKL